MARLLSSFAHGSQEEFLQSPFVVKWTRIIWMPLSGTEAEIAHGPHHGALKRCSPRCPGCRTLE
eukprot:6302170-Amphidinium_carterae.1